MEEQRDEPAWTEQLKGKPFVQAHFTDHFMTSVLQRAKTGRTNRRLPYIVSSVSAVIIVLIIGLVMWKDHQVLPYPGEPAVTPDEWAPTGYFTVNGKRLLGHEGKVGLLKLNGESEDEPFLTTSKGAHYEIYFWGKPDQFQGKYKITANRKDAARLTPLYEWPLETVENDVGSDAMSGGKFGLDIPGRYRLEIYIGETYFDSVVVDVKNAAETLNVIVENTASIPSDDVAKLVELTKKHFQYANENDFARYSDTIHPKPDKLEDGTPIFDVWRDARVRKQNLLKISFETADDVGRPRVIANVDWSDRGMMAAYQKFGDEWKIVSWD